MQHFAAELAEVAEAVRDRRELRRFVAGRLEKLVGFDSVYWGEATQASTDADYVCISSDGAVRRALELFARERRRLDVPAAIRRARAMGSVAIGHEVLPRAESERLPVYAEVVHPAGIRSYIFCELEFRGRPLSTITLSRHARGAPFGSREKALVRSIRAPVGVVEAAFGVGGLPPWAASADAVLRALDGLTARETQVAGLVAHGMGNKAIAHLLGTAPDTVRKQTISIYKKLRVAGRVELASMLAAMRVEVGGAPPHGPNGVWRESPP